MSDAIKEALGKLDPANDNHWTQDGLPRLDTMKILTGNPGLSRDDINTAVPDFSRPNSNAQGAPQAPAVTGAGGSSTDPVVAAPAAPTGEPPQDELPQLTPTMAAKDELEDLDAEMAELQLNYNETVNLEGKVKRRLVELQNAMDAVHNRMVALRKETRDNPIQSYLARQKKDLEDRGARMRHIQESGLRLGELAASLQSPLDAAFAGRRRRG